MSRSLYEMIGSASSTTMVPGGYWVRAVPMPFPSNFFERLKDAWSVLRGETHSVYWPHAGDLEVALEGYDNLQHQQSGWFYYPKAGGEEGSKVGPFATAIEASIARQRGYVPPPSIPTLADLYPAPKTWSAPR